MRMNSKQVWLACGSMAAMAVPTAVFAQNDNAAAPATGAPSTDTGGLTDIVVTAQKRFEKLRNVPIAITAIGGETGQTGMSLAVQPSVYRKEDGSAAALGGRCPHQLSAGQNPRRDGRRTSRSDGKMPSPVA